MFSCMVQSLDLICKMEKPGLCHGGEGLHIKNMSLLLMVNWEHWGFDFSQISSSSRTHTHTHIYINTCTKNKSNAQITFIYSTFALLGSSVDLNKDHWTYSSCLFIPDTQKRDLLNLKIYIYI